MRLLKRLLRATLLPWWTVFLPRRSGIHPYFGPPTKPYGGPDLKIRKLKSEFGNAYWPSHLYLFSGKPLPEIFVRLLRWKKIPVLMDQNGVHYPAWDSDYLRNNQRLQELHRLSDLIIYQSAFCRESTAQWIQPPERPAQLLHNAVDIQQFAVANPAPPQKPFRLLTATYFNPDKRYLLRQLFDVLRLLNQTNPEAYSLTLAGRMDGAEGTRLPPWAEQELRQTGQIKVVSYQGAYDLSEAPRVYQQGHVMVHLTQMDACPTAVLEAMACGLPVIYADSGGTSELVGAKAGVAIPVSTSFTERQSLDIAAVAEAVRAIEKDWDTFHSQARQRAERFDLSPWLEQHRSLMTRLAQR